MVVRSHRDLYVYKRAFQLSMQLFHLSKSFPKDEQYSLTDQGRRSARSVCANLAEAWKKRRYPASFISKITDCEAEAAETQVWLEFAVECGYLSEEATADLFEGYDGVLRTLAGMIQHHEKWCTLKK